ncbi:hypothetical protein LWI29_011529 [Acer saccharum]|uniref:MADS-box domain-containing protein n=1 Tax=Acer saccharum TaxID=4024 RepID=A0AA39RDA9_ACESA|nr:hypothetical protein LWI29_011529 [Acer saccharum]
MAPAEKQRIRRNKLMSFMGEDENYRKAMISFNKRKSTLKKKSAQLSTLCDVEVCMVCVGPDRTVETWPENRSDVLGLIGKFGGLSEKAREKGKQKYNLVGFLGDKKRKLDEKLNKKRKNPEDDESVKNYGPGSVISAWDERLDRFSEEELVGLCGCLDSKLQELSDQIRVYQMQKKEKVPTLIQMKKKEKAPVVELQNPEVRFDHPNNNLDYDLTRFNIGDCFYDQQINSKFERPGNLAFLNENYNNNQVGMVNMNNNLGFETNFSSGFANHANNMGLMRTEESFGLIGESSNYFQSNDHHFMPSHTSPTYLQLHQQVLPSSMRLPSLPFSSDQFSCFG